MSYAIDNQHNTTVDDQTTFHVGTLTKIILPLLAIVALLILRCFFCCDLHKMPIQETSQAALAAVNISTQVVEKPSTTNTATAPASTTPAPVAKIAQ